MKKTKKSARGEFLIHRQQGRHREGLKVLQKLLKGGDVKFDEVKEDLANFYYHLGRYKEAIKIYESSLKAEKRCLNTIQDLARVYALNKDERAVDLAKAAFVIYPNFVMANALANVYDFLGKNDLAEKWYKKTISLAKNKEAALVIKGNLAFFYKRIKKKSLAKKTARKVLQNKAFSKKRKYAPLISVLKSIK